MKRREIRASAVVLALRRKFLITRIVLLWERLWLALWPAAGVAGLFIALSLLDVWALVSGWVHVVANEGSEGWVTQTSVHRQG